MVRSEKFDTKNQTKADQAQSSERVVVEMEVERHDGLGYYRLTAIWMSER